ncbi:LysR family transcriptional regulator [Rhizobium leguminosarum]|uniref:LysR family transcriptional regulator n=1 Tax=Rhizobium TaxID=379 RepID=UPI001C9469F0|nr:LysR family transcriptional regulator [Rhizobium leguminosarum]MBY5392997.1 LysR family transcriptional regulator [Rhizobium leguminosarum]MBY5434384.1 LysR family transcriptional regulator [Rhizobium leguminosarum]
MDPKKLLYMKSVVEHGSFRKAAKELQLSQPALCSSMDRLEASLGVKLLERGPMGVIPTSAGELLYSRAWFIQDEIDVAEKQILEDRCGIPRRLTVGAIVSLVANVVPRAVCKWRAQYPSVPLRIFENAHPELLVGLQRTELDFIIAQTGCFENVEGIKQRVLFRDRLVVLCRPNHPALKGLIAWPELIKYPWVTHLVGRNISPVEQVTFDEGVSVPNQLSECNSVSFMITMIENSDNLGMLPEHAVATELLEGRLVALPITSRILSRDIAVFFRERSLLDAPRRSFIDCVAEAGARLDRAARAVRH